MNDTKGCITLGQSNWVIWSLRNPYLYKLFPLYYQASCNISRFPHGEKRASVLHWTSKVNDTEACTYDPDVGHLNGPFKVHKTNFYPNFLHFFQKPHAAFLFSCMQRKRCHKLNGDVICMFGIYLSPSGWSGRLEDRSE